jgi:hypothetical protein
MIKPPPRSPQLHRTQHQRVVADALEGTLLLGLLIGA